jgi:carboxypeptidase PM20D1
MILEEPMAGAKGAFAMIGLGEKGCADLKFIARSSGGHASTPGKNTPLVRLGKFMAAAETAEIFQKDISPVVAEMLKRISSGMSQPLKGILGNAGILKPILLWVIPKVSASACAMLKTTLAFTMAKGSEGTNVLPQEAYVIGNMRFSHHQGMEASIEAVRQLAAKFDIETEVIQPGFSSPITPVNSDAFRLVERAVDAAYPGVITSPYLMTAASDCRFMSRVSENCLRFVPFKISNEQLDSVHGINENVDISTLPPAVEFYKYIITEANL